MGSKEHVTDTQGRQRGCPFLIVHEEDGCIILNQDKFNGLRIPGSNKRELSLREFIIPLSTITLVFFMYNIPTKAAYKMGYEMNLVKSLNRMEARKLGLAWLVGFCIGVSTCFISMTASTAGQHLSSAYSSPAAESNNYSPISDAGGGHGTEGSSPSTTNGVIRIKQASPSTKYNAPSRGQVKETTRELEPNHGKDADERVQLKTSSSQKEERIESSKPDGTIKAIKAKEKPVCDFSNPRTDVCEMAGDVRIHGKTSSVVLVTDHQPHSSEGKESWQIKPYARKFDKAAMAHLHEVSVRVLSNGLGDDIPHCTISHSVPAIVFALGGYTGNYYHDFTDVLVPLFITSRQFNGEVQFVIETKNLWWISKYEPILKQLSRYEIVYFNSDDRVHCYPHVIVGLHSHKAMSIDAARAPNGYSMADFTKFMRITYSLQRDSPIRLAGENDEAKKPRLLLIPRQGSRRFTNMEEIVGIAEEVGFEVVLAEAKMGTKVSDIARVVNSCDVMMGVHGAGLTNFVFLPTNAVIIQIVPYGNLENISRSCFGYPSDDARLRYLEYSICEEESSLIELYPRDHAVFKDPKSIHRLGWNKMGEVYLDNQDVKLDVNRFKPLLLKARQLLLHDQ